MEIHIDSPTFKLDDLLALELHKFEEEVGEIVDRAQKEEKMENGLNKLAESWAQVAFQFYKHKDTEVHIVKMAEEDFEVGCSQAFLHATSASGAVAACRSTEQVIAEPLPMSPHSHNVLYFSVMLDAGGQPSSSARHDGQSLYEHIQRCGAELEQEADGSS